MPFSVNEVFKFAFSPFYAVCMPLRSVIISAELTWWNNALAISVTSSLTGRCILVSPVCVGCSELAIRAFCLYDVDLAPIRPTRTVRRVIRTHPKTRPSTLILWHFYTSFDVAIFKICLIFRLYESGSEVTGFSITSTCFAWFI